MPFVPNVINRLQNFDQYERGIEVLDEWSRVESCSGVECQGNYIPLMHSSLFVQETNIIWFGTTKQNKNEWY
mgnify:CR=1 FL=1